MSAPKTKPSKEKEDEYLKPSFRGALVKDWWTEGEPERYVIHSGHVADIRRASAAVTTIARLVHNSISEPLMSGVEPLGAPAHLGLLNALEIVGAHLHEVAEHMFEDAKLGAEILGEREPWLARQVE
ncbi:MULTISPECIES: hypothetical protein [Pandoraea]|uniref:hypothetical protein n=1 Tax=Pandoraea TaxID=93217 RepID=UPI001F5C790D|nr:MULTISPECIES: hypothetical protein [Pandoraea]MCI3206539.1 hypothetical protein [Pandoraea sp. LA3]MDN4584567.1 hypothetical protein [Pandoraea capi]